ncbi:GlxA family transcriptional regulator [Pseudomonas violetae]|jgi:AraC family transcriptional regulator, glycine betaine-responsive activator|uniref:Helix-turn-helix domain-containing protein n=1 Tax=Pseudomonas violetae TaxID=2915813 RepID=A0ABT0EUJ0_9PSED|nr:helix-turn-helix domain-containing protein [Pseudomonas violetae]MCK1789407.1 helix-turn-helix domain-containing protein [Pseudomonas violetae]
MVATRVDEVLKMGFWLTEDFDLFALANALEPLRLANQVAGRTVCQWQILSLEGHSLSASNAVATATARLDQASALDVLILCAGAHQPLEQDFRQQLRHWTTQPILFGALGKAGWLLAQMGALDGFRCSLPEPDSPLAFVASRALSPVAAPFCVDGQRLTCVGPEAVRGLVCELLAQVHGRSLVLRMEQHLARQNRPLQPLEQAPEKLQTALALMSDHLTHLLAIEELAEAMGISRRHLERLFKRTLGCSPSRHYLDLRLQQSRRLLQTGERSIAQAAGECGFVAVQHFIRCYRHYFGAHPREHAVACTADLTNYRSDSRKKLRLASVRMISSGPPEWRPLSLNH